MGRSICLALAEVGANVVVTSRNLSACEAVAEQVRAAGVGALAHSCHIGHWDELDRLVDTAYNEFGSVEILVNNAGKSPLYDSILGITEVQWRSVIDVNLSGPFRLAALVGTRMVEGQGGTIVNISSSGSVRPRKNIVPYAAAKAGLNAITMGLAEAFAPKVRVNTILPGAFETDVAAYWTAEVRAGIETSTALKRVASPDEITGAVLHLVSDASSFTTGALLRVDGGTF
jgi:NAD(P)-dependent dehydrogenase (short-subunit alcohol dehydrogenase family)